MITTTYLIDKYSDLTIEIKKEKDVSTVTMSNGQVFIFERNLAISDKSIMMANMLNYITEDQFITLG